MSKVKSTQMTLALTKGRILKETLPLLKSAGIEPVEDLSESRKLHIGTNNPDVNLLILRGSDVITYIRHGIADIGVVGKDMLLEDGGEELYEMVDLKIARCRLMTAAMKSQTAKAKSRIRVATKYVKIAKAYYARMGVQADIVKLYGGMELAPLMGLSDEIVDIVDSGRTLEANGLVAKDHIVDISSRLVVNMASKKVKHRQVVSFIEAVEEAVQLKGE